MSRPFHTLSWIVWLAAAFLPAVITNNPVYLLTLLLVVGTTYYILGRNDPLAKSWLVFLQVGLALMLFNVLFNLISVSAGNTILFELPHWTITAPGNRETILWKLGGAVTLESISYSLASGLALLAILAVFATFNTLVDHYQILRYTPRFLTQTAVIVSIAITFIPQMILAQKEIREAQTLRGHRFNGLRDLLPLFVIILSEGLERALTLAESMEARGFGRQAAPGREVWFKAAFSLELLGLVAGTLWMMTQPVMWPGQVISGLSLAMLGATLWLVGQGVHRSRYRRELWRPRDTGVAIACGIVAAAWLGIYLAHRD
ncbi:MAG: CbiQ family ECF transporter T component, partial [Anaerolineae bacterium]